MYHRNINAGPVLDDTAIFRSKEVREGDVQKAWDQPRGLTMAAYATDMLHSGQAGTDAQNTENVKLKLFHQSNIAIHVCNVVLTAMLLMSLGLSPWWGTLYFLISPIAVNSVANVAGRAGLLGYYFSSSALLLALLGGWAHILVPLYLYLAYKSKEDSLMVVPLLIVLMFWRHQFWAAHFYLGIATLGLIYKWDALNALRKARAIRQDTGWPQHITGGAWRKTFLYESLVRWPKWFLGFGYRIAPQIEETSPWKTLLVIFLALLIGAFMILGSTMPMLILGMLIFLLSSWWAYLLKPLPDVILEHRAYQSMLGLAVIVAAIQPQIPVWLMTGWLVYLATVTRERAGWWTPGVLYERAIEEGPCRPIIYLNLSSYLIKLGRVMEAEQHLNAVLEKYPNLFHAWMNLGTIYQMRNQPRIALLLFQRAAFRCPNLTLAWQMYGDQCIKRQKYKRALVAYRRAVRLSPKWPDVWQKHKMLQDVVYS